MNTTAKLALPLLALFLGLSGKGLASDHANLEEGLPTRLQDAVPTTYRNREVQAYFRWEREKDESLYELVSRIEAGVWLNTQAELEVPYRWGPGAKEDGFGDVKAAVLYNFNQETPWVPMAALQGAVEFPTGEGSEGLDTTVTLLLSKTVPRTSYFKRIHLNAGWTHNAEAKEEERSNLYRVAVGDSFRAGADTMLLFDYVWEQAKQKGKEAQLLELGARRQLTPFTLVAAGVSAGLTRESPDFQATAGFQHSF